jgi:hypothetical protein
MMMNKINWWMVAALALAAVVALLVGTSLLPSAGGYASESGQDTTHWEMMSDGGGWWSWSPLFALLMPLFMLLMPLLWLGLMILGIVWLARAVFGPRDQGTYRPAVVPTLRAETQGEACAECGRPVQAGWQVCPHCGHKLT